VVWNDAALAKLNNLKKKKKEIKNKRREKKKKNRKKPTFKYKVMEITIVRKTIKHVSSKMTDDTNFNQQNFQQFTTQPPKKICYL
jgi:hypothetical protein